MSMTFRVRCRQCYVIGETRNCPNSLLRRIGSFEASSEPMKKVEYWRWRYRDPQLGCIRRTTAALTEEEAASYPEAERIEGSLTLHEVNDDLGENSHVCSDGSNATGLNSISRPQGRC
jgi:hypothetical protein